MKVPVWGWNKPGTKVTVEFAGQKKTATTGEDGKIHYKRDRDGQPVVTRAQRAVLDTLSAATDGESAEEEEEAAAQ